MRSAVGTDAKLGPTYIRQQPKEKGNLGKVQV